jgi:hypothetical protein
MGGPPVGRKLMFNWQEYHNNVTSRDSITATGAVPSLQRWRRGRYNEPFHHRHQRKKRNTFEINGIQWLLQLGESGAGMDFASVASASDVFQNRSDQAIVLATH